MTPPKAAARRSTRPGAAGADVTVVPIAGSGHNLMAEHPEETLDALRQWLPRCDARAQVAAPRTAARTRPARARRRRPRRATHALATVVLTVALIVLGIAWETVLAPLRPGGSLLVLKALPLLLVLPAFWKGLIRHYQLWSMLILAYLCEGVVRGMSDGGLLPCSAGSKRPWPQRSTPPSCATSCCAGVRRRLHRHRHRHRSSQQKPRRYRSPNPRAPLAPTPGTASRPACLPHRAGSPRASAAW